MNYRKTFASIVLAALVAGCAAPQLPTRSAGYDLTAPMVGHGLYR